MDKWHDYYINNTLDNNYLLLFTCSKNDVITSTICAKRGYSLAPLFQHIIMSLCLETKELTIIIFGLSQSDYQYIHFPIHSFNI